MSIVPTRLNPDVGASNSTHLSTNSSRDIPQSISRGTSDGRTSPRATRPLLPDSKLHADSQSSDLRFGDFVTFVKVARRGRNALELMRSVSLNPSVSERDRLAASVAIIRCNAVYEFTTRRVRDVLDILEMTNCRAFPVIRRACTCRFLEMSPAPRNARKCDLTLRTVRSSEELCQVRFAFDGRDEISRVALTAMDFLNSFYLISHPVELATGPEGATRTPEQLFETLRVVDETVRTVIVTKGG